MNKEFHWELCFLRTLGVRYHLFWTYPLCLRIRAVKFGHVYDDPRVFSLRPWKSNYVFWHFALCPLNVLKTRRLTCCVSCGFLPAHDLHLVETLGLLIHLHCSLKSMEKTDKKHQQQIEMNTSLFYLSLTLLQSYVMRVFMLQQTVGHNRKKVLGT